MKEWRIPVSYEMAGVVKVQANTLEEAIKIAADEAEEIPLPDDADYIPGSWLVAHDDVDFLRSFYNGDQSDVGSIKVKIYNIDWDVDDEEDVDLPVAVEHTFSGYDSANSEELFEEISDWLSDTYGFCHKCFSVEPLCFS